MSTDEQQNESLALELRSASYDSATRTATFAVHLLNGFHPTNWKDGFHAPTLVIDDALINPDAWKTSIPSVRAHYEQEPI